MAKLPLHTLAWAHPDRRGLYRAVLILTGNRLTPWRLQVARHNLLEDLEIYDDPRQGAGSWIAASEQAAVERLGEALHLIDPMPVSSQDAYAELLPALCAAASALRTRLEANGARPQLR